MDPSLKRPVLLASAFYLAVTGFFILRILRVCHGHFGYVLDDPYIHLALSEQLAHGHYGINPQEFSSPSSSILWPFLLAPFAGTRVHVYFPLILNLLCGTASAGLIGGFVARWRVRDDASRWPAWAGRAVVTILLIFAANLVGLTLIGMEHSLQVLLAICCAYGMAYALENQAIPAWCLAAAAIAPVVRYEDLTLTAAVSLALAGRREWKRAAALLSLSLLPLLAFSVFLHSKGLALLPSSVLVKSHSMAGHHVAEYLAKLFPDFYDSARFPLCALTGLLIIAASRSTSRSVRFTLAGAAAAGVLQLIVGPFGWFHRYEPYAAIFLALVLLARISEEKFFPVAYLAFGLLFASVYYTGATTKIPQAAHEIYTQQFQMHRFVTEFYQGDYAVNDLGWVSFQRRPGAYVLDVEGLASAEAANEKHKTPQWLDAIVQRHEVKLAMLYPEWFPIPSTWTPEARLCTGSQENLIVLAHNCMVFYSTTAGGNAAIHEELKAFGQTVPKEDVFTLDPGKSEATMGGVKARY